MNAGRRLLLLMILIFLGAVLDSCGDEIDTNMSESVVDFEFTTQDEETLTLDDLKGDWWLSYMSYTDCRTVCPRTTTNMVNVQNKLKKDGLYPQIISFNVDPANDTPEDLREYADEYNVDLDTWDFLTGYEFKTIQDMSEKVFHAVLEKGAADQMSHSYMFYLINPEGEVIKKYDGMSTDELNILIDDLKIVL